MMQDFLRFCTPADNDSLQGRRKGIICEGNEPDLHPWPDHLDPTSWCL